jgi:predicted permease
MNLWFDVKYAWRLMNKSRGHSILCASVVALSVGLALWAYQLIYSQALKPLGFPSSDRWYSLQIAPDTTTSAVPSIDAFTYQEIVKRNRNADFLGAFRGEAFVISEGGASASLRTAAISPRLLAATAVIPQVGRLFQEDDGRPDAVPTVILNFDTWQNYFAADPKVVGQQTRIDSRPVQIVGVMPRNFYAFQDFEAWVPLQLPNLATAEESNARLTAFIYLKDDNSLEGLTQEMNVAVAEVNREYSEIYKSERHAELIPAYRMFTHSRTQFLAILAVLAIAILLLGCVNISMVFLARLMERSRELALRTALGASRARLMRQGLLETAFIVALGLLLGCGFAALANEWAQGLDEFGARIKATGHSANVPTLRPTDLIIAVLTAAAIWLLSTLIPAWRITKQDPALILAGTGKSAALGSSSRSAKVLVGLQVSISCLVLVICGNMVLAADEEANRPTGLSTEKVLISTYPTVMDARYTDQSARLQYWEQLAASVESKLPGAETALATTVPTRPANTAMALETQEGTADQGTLTLPLTTVSADYFALLGIQLRLGRLFESTDNVDSLKVAIIDEKLAQRYWPNQDVLGKRLQVDPKQNGPWLTIIGVVSSVAGAPYARDPGVVYQPFQQAVPTNFHLLVKLPSVAPKSRVTVRAAAYSVDRDLPLHNLQLLDDFWAALNLNFTAMVGVMTTIALITCILAASGLFGLISRSVAQRTQEVGIRRALGATRWGAISMFLRQGAMYLSVGGFGVVLGILVSNVLSRALANILNNVLVVLIAVLVLMAIVIFVASYLPSRKAVALEPGDALRYD